jgi:DNA-directed RNA polymerase beta subunit/DNA-directed RNA polymerase beta' subunit
MLVLNPQTLTEDIQRNVIEKIKSFFPIVGRKHTLKLNSLEIANPRSVDDIHSQDKAKRNGRTWSAGVFGNFSLLDRETGKTIDHQPKMKIVGLPALTRRYSFIIDGNEYQTDHVWRLKSGVYSRIAATGEPEVMFNLKQGFNQRGFRLILDPDKKKFSFKYASAKIPLYPVLNALGVSDATLEKTWGKEIFAASKTNPKEQQVALRKLLVSLKDPVPEEAEDVVTAVKDRFQQTVLRPDSTILTLGKAYDTVAPSSLVTASENLLQIHRGERDPDNRDALPFKDLLGVEDLLPDRLDRAKTKVVRKIRNNLDRKERVREMFSSSIFSGPLMAFFRESAVANQTPQTNPISMVSKYLGTTLLGSDVGAIGSSFGVTMDAKATDPTQLGVLDPVHTPEGERAGISLKLTTDARRKNGAVSIPAYNTKTKKIELVTPLTLSQAVVSFPDQFHKKDTGWTPVTKKVTAQTPTDVRAVVDPSKVEYVLPSSTSMFAPMTNLVPFLQNDDGTRVEMAVRHMEQALPLKHREVPLVQTHSRALNDPETTHEKTWAAFAAHASPVAGKVTKVDAAEITVTDSAGKAHVIQLYKNFPLNEMQAFINSEPSVSVGDSVKKGGIVADSTYTKDGTLAMGVNLKVAYVPYAGLTFEDGLIVSETAAKKLTSEHMHRPSIFMDRDYVLNKKKFTTLFPESMSGENRKKLDDDGVIKIGAEIAPGETLIAAAKRGSMTPEKALLKGIHRSLLREYSDRSVIWDKNVRGEVVDVVRRGKYLEVHVRADFPAQPGDKISARHGNKGVISIVLPDDEMPKDKDGNSVELIMNPLGVAGRMNAGQVLETALSHVAEHEGSPLAVRNFQADAAARIIKVRGHWRTIKVGPKHEDKKRIWVEPYEYERDYREAVDRLLKDRGLSEEEELFDDNDKSLGKVLTGKQYIFKLNHQSEKKAAARSWGPGYEYSVNMEPRGGGKHGAQRIGELGLFALLSHGAVHNIREMQTAKSDASQDDIWTAVQLGQPVPRPKVPFTFTKFVAYLKVLGLDVEREGDILTILPFTDKQVLGLSNGKLKDPAKILRAKDLRPEAGGLFDEGITGGVGGKNFSHYPLAEAFPNPMFERPITALLGLTHETYEQLVAGELGMDKVGNIVPAESASRVGPASTIGRSLRELDTKAELLKARTALNSAKESTRNALNRKVKYLRALERSGLKADVYMQSNVLVLPPQFRPITVLDDGNLNRGDLNQLYKELSLSNSRLREMPPETPEEELAKLRAEVYGGLVALAGLMGAERERLDVPKGILDIIAGKSPKTGYFMEQLVKRKQDLSARGVIVPSQTLQLDEVGVPEKTALELFRPFVIQNLVRNGARPLQAKELIMNHSPEARIALEQVLKERPVLLKRDPVLHKYGIMAFNVRLMGDKEIHIHPLVCSAYNADFDGDQVALFVPVSQAAVKEAYNMLPSRNLLNPSTGQPMFLPVKESLVGLYLLTRTRSTSSKKFGTADDLVAAAEKQSIPWDAQVTLAGKKTTAGQELLRKKLPAKFHKYIGSGKDWVLSKNGLRTMFKEVAQKTPQEYPQLAQTLKDLGFAHAHTAGFSFNLDSFKTLDAIRDSVLKQVEPKIEAIKKLRIPKDIKEARIVAMYHKASASMQKDALEQLKKDDNPLWIMMQAGVKPGWGQIKQILVARMMVDDASGNPIPGAITGNYGSGLSLHDYWMSSGGIRRGIIQKTQEVQDPGAISKQVMKTTMGITVTTNDCKTPKGISVPLAELTSLDRTLAQDTKVKGGVLSAGTTITPDAIAKLKQAKVSRIIIRSPLKCQAQKGICQKCYGIDPSGNQTELGTNVGAIATQSVGEPATQLAMRQFHCHHPGTMVHIKRPGGRVRYISLKQLFWEIGEEAFERNSQEFKLPAEYAIWDGAGWSELQKVGRHKKCDAMRLLRVSTGELVVQQSNHPVPVRPTPKFCACGTAFTGTAEFIGSKKASGSYYIRCQACDKVSLVEKAAWAEAQRVLSYAGDVQPGVYLERPEPPEVNTAFTCEYTGYVVGSCCAEGHIEFKPPQGSGDVAGAKGARVPTDLHGPVLTGSFIGQEPGAVRERIGRECLLSGLKVSSQKNGFRILGGKLVARQLLALCGEKSAEKHLPWDFLGATLTWRRSLLAGLVDGDGTIKAGVNGGYDRVVYYTSSLTLAVQVQALARSLGIQARVSRTTTRDNQTVQGLLVCLAAITSVWQLIPSLKITSASNLDAKLPAEERSTVVPVTAALSFPYPEEGWVYDVTSGSGVFVASGLLTHNTGGASSTTESLIDGIERLRQVIQMPQKLKGSATLATASGIVSSVTKSPVGGWSVQVGAVEHHIPASRKLKVVKGVKVSKGEPLSSGPINPRNLLELTNISTVQNYIVDQLATLYDPEKVKHRHLEVIAKALTDVSSVEDAGSHPDLLPGDVVPTRRIQAWNSANSGGEPVTFKPTLKGTNILPFHLYDDWLTKLNYKHLRNVLQQAGAEQAISHIHGEHPIPGIVYGAEFGDKEGTTY